MPALGTILSHLVSRDIFPRESQDEVVLMAIIKSYLLWQQAGSRSNQFGFMVSGMDSNGAKDHMLLELLATDGHETELQFPCRICGQVGLKSVNSSVGGDDHASAPAGQADELAWCPTCSLVQIAESRPNTMSLAAIPCAEDQQAARLMADSLCSAQQLGSESLVMEFMGSEYLRNYRLHGVPVLQVEQSPNAARMADSDAEIPCIRESLSHELALQLVRNNQRADLVHLGAAFSQADDLNGIVSSLSTILKPEGIIVVQVPYLKDLVQRASTGIDLQYRSCFSLTSLTQLFGQHGLEVIDVSRQQTEGGSLRVTVGRFGIRSATAAVHEMMEDESEWVRDARFLNAFGEGINRPSNDRRAA